MTGYEDFLEYCRSVKPPYQCPVAACSRIYKSLLGIQSHMTSFDHTNLPATPSKMQTPGTGRKKGQKRTTSPILGQLISGGEPDLPPVPFSTDMKNVEFELDGKCMKISVFDPIEMLSKEDYEASLPPPVEETPITETAKTPVAKPPQKIPAKKTSKNRNTIAAAEKGCDVQRYTIEDKKAKSLPEASFTIIEDYYDNLPDAPPLPDEYYKFIEKTPQELAEEVEYDLDEEDCSWLRFANEEREKDNLTPVSLAALQLLLDRLEKESFFQAESCGRGDSHMAPIDEDAVCCICMDGECQNSNVILFCDMCNLAVHQECYGVPYIPEGQWLCRRCLQSPSRAVDCALCPNTGGAFKQTDDGRWAHVVCAMWIPEVCFANTVFLEPIDSISNIPPARWKLTCYICKQRGVGACIQCNKANCYTAFHVTCAQQAALHMKIDAIRETSTAGTSVTVRKAAYCDMHTPHDTEQGEDGDAAKRAAEAKAAWRQKMKQARKILAEKRSAAPLVALPTIPPDRIQALAGLVHDVTGMSQFMHRLLAFWTLKRQSRNGVPLLRRLIAAHSSRRHLNTSHNTSDSNQKETLSPEKEADSVVEKMEVHEESHDHGVKRKDTVDKSTDDVLPKKKRRLLQPVVDADDKNKQQESRPETPNDNISTMVEKMRYFQRVRQDLEKVRLLCELVSKRERTKQKLVQIWGELRMVQLAPMVALQLLVLDQLQQRDVNQIFAEPVDLEEVTDYSEVVSCPMDLSTMRQNAKNHKYTVIDDLEKDFELMIENCLSYNAKETIFYKSALKFREQGASIFSAARRSTQISGIDCKTGLLLPQRPKPPPVLSDSAIADQIDSYLSTLTDQKRSDKQELRRLLDLAYQINYHVLRYSKVRAIRKELVRVRRKSGDDEERPSTATESTEDESEVEGLAKAPCRTAPIADKKDGKEMDKNSSKNKSGKGKHEAESNLSRKSEDSKVKEKRTGDSRVKGKSEDDSKAATVEVFEPKEHKKGSRSERTDKADSVKSKVTKTTESDLRKEGKETVLPEEGVAPSDEEPAHNATSRRGSRNRPRVGSARRGKTTPTPDDVKQKRIDSFFCKVGSPSATAVSSSICTEHSDAPPADASEHIDSKTRDSVHDSIDNGSVKVPSPATVDNETSDTEAAAVDSETCVLSAEPPRRGRGRLSGRGATRKRGRPPKRTLSGSGDTAAEKPAERSDEKEVQVSSQAEEKQEETVTESTTSTVATLDFSYKNGVGLENPLGGLGTSFLDLERSVPSTTKDSFKVYRTGREAAPETDEDTHSESTRSSLGDSDFDSCSDSDDDEEAARDSETQGDYRSGRIDEIQLEPLDLVWAKLRGYPWYPALIIDPKMPRTGYFHNRVPIPVPPLDILELVNTYPPTHQYLVLFFDSKRTWNWLPRSKLEPLGESPELDKAKLVESRKPADRKAVKRAYEQAILHRCRVTGDSEGLVDDSEGELQQ